VVPPRAPVRHAVRVTESAPFRDAMGAAAAGAEDLQAAAVMLDDPGAAMIAFSAAELVARVAEGASPDTVRGTVAAVREAVGDQLPADRFQQVEQAAASASLPDLLAGLAGLLASVGELFPGPVGDAAHATARALADASAAVG
jgi:hypothetical protein